MIATQLAEQVTTVLQQGTLAAPEPKGINTEGVVTFFASNIAPILLAVLGVIFIGRASRGEISKVLTSSAIAIVGLAFIRRRDAVLRRRLPHQPHLQLRSRAD